MYLTMSMADGLAIFIFCSISYRKSVLCHNSLYLAVCNVYIYSSLTCVDDIRKSFSIAKYDGFP